MPETLITLVVAILLSQKAVQKLGIVLDPLTG